MIKILTLIQMGYLYTLVPGEGGAKLPTHPKSHKNDPLIPQFGHYVEQLLNLNFQPKKLVWRHNFL